MDALASATLVEGAYIMVAVVVVMTKGPAVEIEGGEEPKQRR